MLNEVLSDYFTGFHRRSLRAFDTTQTLERDMAADAITLS